MLRRSSGAPQRPMYSQPWTGCVLAKPRPLHDSSIGDWAKEGMYLVMQARKFSPDALSPMMFDSSLHSLAPKSRLDTKHGMDGSTRTVQWAERST
jgi:hypothetical protein